MTHADVYNEQKNLAKVVNDWHRDRFPEEHKAIDIDLMGCCPRCKRPLYLIEATEQMEGKPTSYLRALAVEADTPAFLIFHIGPVVTGVQRIHPNRSEIFNEQKAYEYLCWLRQEHDCERHA